MRNFLYPLICFAIGAEGGGGSEGDGGGAGAAPPVGDTPVGSQDQPVQGDGQGDPGGQATDWEQRYKDAQAWGTKLSQRAKELEQYETLINGLREGDPEAAAALGISFGDDDDGEYEEDGVGYGQLDPVQQAQLDQITQWVAEQQETAEQAQATQQFKAQAGEDLKQMGIPAEVTEPIADIAMQLPPIETPYGQKPDYEGAIEALTDIAMQASQLPAVRNKFFESYKQSKSAPVFSQSGRSGTEAPDMDDREQRLAWMMDKLDNG